MTEVDENKLFMQLFAGRRDAFAHGKGNIERRQLTDRMYLDHLKGTFGSDIGVYLVRDDGTVSFGAIDIDEPNFPEAQRAAKRIEDAFSAPAFIERSRSGNYHVWVFFQKPTPAWAVMGVLRFVVETLPKVHEVFPKQPEVHPGGVGNYISLPWHGDYRPILRPDGSGEELERALFLEFAMQSRHAFEPWVATAREVGAIPPSERKQTSDWGDRNSLHICAQHIVEHAEDNPVMEGARAVVYFNLAKMFLNCRHYTAAEALQELEWVNSHSPDPVSERELQRFVGNAERGGWTSTGCDDPLMAPYVHPKCAIAHG